MKFWFYKREDIYRLPPVTQEEIENAEKTLKCTLPNTYKELIKVQNGGRIRFNAFIREGMNEAIEFTYLLGIGKNYGILDSAELIKEWRMPKKLVIINQGDGHEMIALDYRKKLMTHLLFIFKMKLVK